MPRSFLCAACRGKPPAYDSLTAAFAYEPPVDSLIGALKFRRLEYLGDDLAAALLLALGGHAQQCDLVVPVPLHWRRRLQRGFNQAEVIARPLARSLGLPMLAALYRRRATHAQARLEREARLRNPRGAFAVREARRIHGARVILVDDVVTTAATVQAAAKALKSAGAAHVLVAAIARTLAHG